MNGTTSTQTRPNKLLRLISDDAGFFYTPVNAMVLNALLTAAYIIVGEFATLLTFSGVAGYTFYFSTVLGLIILRVREPDLVRPYKTWITTPIIFCCVSLFLLSRAVFAKPEQTLIVVAFVLAGVPVYFWRVRRKNRKNGEKGGSGWKFWKRWRAG
jgi:amino acid transporter